jgi:molecular chaperone DnaK
MATYRVLGIDFGTTRLALARVDESGRSGMVRSIQGDLLFDSVLYFEDDDFLFGRAARHSAAAQPNRAAEYVKRDFGQKAYSRAIGGELLPTELIGGLLLKRACEDMVGEGVPLPPVALSVPASFDQAQRKSLLDSATIAGLDVLGTVSDPLAAAIAFAESQGLLTPEVGDKPGSRILVFDLGGSKTDVAIVEVKPGRIRTLAVTGDARLGGRDWDMRLADNLADQFAKQFDADPRYDMVSVRRLLESAAEAKQTLTARPQARVHVERQQQSADITITRTMFEEISEDLVARAKRLVEDVLNQAAMAWRDVSHLLLVGGASRMPMIGRMLEAVTGLTPLANIHADEAVARGAAVVGESMLAARERRASKTKIEIVDLTPHSLGIEWDDPQTNRKENVVIIRRGTELPCATLAKIATTTDDQRSVSVQLVEGEGRNAADCSPIAQLTIADLPPNLARNSPIEVHYQFTVQNRLQIKAQLPGRKQSLKIEVQRDRGLNDAQLAGWKKLVAERVGLKPILALLPKQQNLAPKPRSAPPPLPVSMATGPAADGEVDAGQMYFDPSAGVSSSAARPKKRGSGPRKTSIMLAGHVIFAVLGLLIGYYILMWIDPRFNTLHIRLPGLSPAADSGPAYSEGK